ncbi:hypothetical protein [Alkalimonas amylolytica]|uniref:DUF1240 domain-containing protein n=1 Tax=Alkalimonas amylolytica TaxID=152573 RepID=A0A1H3ZNX9_ALKAM|nr:hypothetical protein [Alkalimonas amylolytica]SEA25377.1 hypothetical protein SAMN04488051_102281 [Alkalimonas amylolytica]
MNQHSKIKDFLALLFFGLLLVIGCWTLVYSLQIQLTEISSEKPLIVLSSFHGYIPGALVALVFMLSYAVNRLWRSLRKQPLSSDNGKITAVGVLTGLVLVFVGNFVISAHWNKSAVKAGYQACPAFTLLTNRVTMTAWSKEETWCFDADARRIIVRGTTDETQQLSQLLSRKQKQTQ